MACSGLLSRASGSTCKRWNSRAGNLRGFVSSCGWVVASLPWRRGGRHRQAVRRKSVHRSAKLASRSRFGAFVYTVAPRALRCELRRVVRAPQPPWRAGGAPLAGRFSLGREDRLCASGATVRLASSPRQQPTQIPDGPGSSGLYEGREGRPPREGPSPWICSPDGPVTLLPFKVGRDRPDSGVESR